MKARFVGDLIDVTNLFVCKETFYVKVLPMYELYVNLCKILYVKKHVYNKYNGNLLKINPLKFP